VWPFNKASGDVLTADDWNEAVRVTGMAVAQKQTGDIITADDWNALAGCLGGGCTRDCSDKQCGDDGCGGSCGKCGVGEICQSGVCVLKKSIDISDNNDGSNPYYDTIFAGEEKYYYFKAKADRCLTAGLLCNKSLFKGGRKIEIFARPTAQPISKDEWELDLDMIVSNEKQPTCNEVGKYEQDKYEYDFYGFRVIRFQRLPPKYPVPWYDQFIGGISGTGGSGEYVPLNINYTNGDIFYVTICGISGEDTDGNRFILFHQDYGDDK
jgi:hypothetical protein